MDTTLQNQKKAKTGLVVAGVLASASLVLLNSNARTKVKDTSRTMKDSVNKYATTIKEDPNGTKQALITRVQNATEISKEAINKIQAILDTQAKDIKETTKNVADESKEVLSSAKDAQGNLMEAKDKALEAKDELISAKDDVKSNSSEDNNNKTATTTDHTITKTPVS
ncbi:hypothetical protein [Oceanobacillus damuensis]|uniref:hypothetical protein n=1 Tax=Oceanobacillus damuensis TaxID=937928 RepID=UPI00082FBB28|nr:hypothetical protein [Oceanobacillus damuensis]